MKDSRQISIAKNKAAPNENKNLMMNNQGKRKVYVSHTKIFNNPDFQAVGGDPTVKKWVEGDKIDQNKSKSVLGSPSRHLDTTETRRANATALVNQSMMAVN